MIQLKGKDGEVLIEVDETRFPVYFDVRTKWGQVEYPISVNLEKDFKTVKTMNMWKRPKA